MIGCVGQRAWDALACHARPQLEESEGREWGVGSVVVEFGVFGAPRFSVQSSPKPFKTSILGALEWKSGRPKNAKLNHDGSNPPFAALWRKESRNKKQDSHAILASCHIEFWNELSQGMGMHALPLANLSIPKMILGRDCLSALFRKQFPQFPPPP